MRLLVSWEKFKAENSGSLYGGFDAESKYEQMSTYLLGEQITHGLLRKQVNLLPVYCDHHNLIY